MAPRDDPFLAWLSGLSGPLGAHQSRLLIGALLDRLRHGSSPAVRRLWHGFFYKWWTHPTLLQTSLLTGTGPTEFNRIMEQVRQAPRRGRRPTPHDQLRRQYTQLLAWAETLPATNLNLANFRQRLRDLVAADIIPAGSIPAARVWRLYRFVAQPQRLVLEILHLTTGKSVKTLRQQIRPSRATRPPAP